MKFSPIFCVAAQVFPQYRGERGRFFSSEGDRLFFVEEFSLVE
jgi:hypothetical protein